MNFFPFPNNMIEDLSPEALLFLFLIILLITVLWIWSLVEVLRRKDFKNSTEKLVWVFVIISTFFLGTILYYFIARARR